MNPFAAAFVAATIYYSPPPPMIIQGSYYGQAPASQATFHISGTVAQPETRMFRILPANG